MNVFTIRRQIERLQPLVDEHVRRAGIAHTVEQFREHTRLATDLAAKIRNLRAVARDLGEPA